MKLRVMFDLVDNMTKPLKALLAGNKGLAHSVAKTRRELAEMDKIQKHIAGFREMRTGLATTTSQLGAARARVNELAAAMRVSGAPSRKMIVEFERAKRAASQLATEHQKQSVRVRELRDQLANTGISTRNLAHHERTLRSSIAAATTAMNDQLQKLDALAARERRLMAARRNMQAARAHATSLTGTGAKMIAGGAAVGASLLAPVAAFARAENSATQLATALMRAGEMVPPEFERINALAIRLGDRLPGTTADFQDMMTMLSRQGITPHMILGGMGEATAYLAVQLKKAPAEAAEFTAKLQDATRTAEKDMLSLTDVIQRAYMLGLEDDNMLQGFAKLGPAMDMIKMKGLEGAKALAPLLVMADQAGMTDGGSVGNAYRKVFQLGMDATRVKKANKLLEPGLQLDFTDGKGEFGGLEHMFGQLKKLKSLSTQTKGSVLKTLFGDDAETLQVVALMIEKGKSGYDEVLAKMAVQASIQERVKRSLGTLSAQWDAATGTFMNGLAAIGEAIAPDVKRVVDWFGTMAQRMSEWARENPRTANGLMKVVGALGLLLATGGALTMALAAVLGPLAIVKFSMAALGMHGTSLGLVLRAGAAACRAFGVAATFAGRAVLMNPIGLAITAVVAAAIGAAYLLRRYWEPITAFFGDVWRTVRGAFDSGLGAVGALILDWSPMGLFYRAFAAVMSWFGFDLPATFSECGANLVRGLVNGITSGLGAVKDAISRVATHTVEWFKEKLGIRSPSRVFGELGSFIGEGAALGVESQQKRVARAAMALAAVATTSFGSPALATGAQLAKPADVPLVRPSVPIDSRPPLAAAPARQSAASAPSQIVINIYPAASADPTAIAQAVRAELDRRERAKQSRLASSLSDRAG